jgi:hypothetical protein
MIMFTKQTRARRQTHSSMMNNRCF